MPRGQRRISVSIGATQITETRLISSPIIQHIVRRVDDTPISEDPFAHLYVEDVFPVDVYDQILENLPGIDTYVEFAKTDHVSDGYNRNRMYLSSAQKELERIPLNLQAYWRELFGMLNSEELLHVLYEGIHQGALFISELLLRGRLRGLIRDEILCVHLLHFCNNEYN